MHSKKVYVDLNIQNLKQYHKKRVIENQKNSYMQKQITILEMGADGGSIKLCRITDPEKNHWFYHCVNEMAYEDLDIEAVHKDSQYSPNITEAFEKMIDIYTSVLSLYPLFVHPDYKINILGYLKKNIRTTNNEYDLYQWAKVFQIEESELKDLLY